MSFKFDDLIGHAADTEKLYSELCLLKSEYFELLTPTLIVESGESVFDDIEKSSKKLEDSFANAKTFFEKKDLGEFATYATRCSNESENLSYYLLKSLNYCVDSVSVSNQEFKHKAKELYTKAIDFSVHFRIFVNMI